MLMAPTPAAKTIRLPRRRWEITSATGSRACPRPRRSSPIGSPRWPPSRLVWNRSYVTTKCGRHLAGGKSLTSYGGGKGLELIPAERIELILGIPAWQSEDTTPSKQGWADESFLLKYRLLSANEERATISDCFPGAFRAHRKRRLHAASLCVLLLRCLWQRLG